MRKCKKCGNIIYNVTYVKENTPIFKLKSIPQNFQDFKNSLKIFYMDFHVESVGRECLLLECRCGYSYLEETLEKEISEIRNIIEECINCRYIDTGTCYNKVTSADKCVDSQTCVFWKIK